MNHKIHSFPLPDDHYCICRVPWGPELPLCLFRRILGAGTSYMFDFIMIMLEIPEMRNSVFPEIVSPLNSFLSKNSVY